MRDHHDLGAVHHLTDEDDAAPRGGDDVRSPYAGDVDPVAEVGVRHAVVDARRLDAE